MRFAEACCGTATACGVLPTLVGPEIAVSESRRVRTEIDAHPRPHIPSFSSRILQREA